MVTEPKLLKMSNSVESKLTEQTILHGSVHEALIKNAITCHDILNYLLTNLLSLESMIAYRAVCQFNTQQIINNKPFILQTEHNEYVAIYYLSGIKDGSDEENIEINKKVHTIVPRLFNNKSIQLICDISSDSGVSYEIIVASRSMKLIMTKFNKIKDNYKIWLKYDYLTPLKNINYKKYENDLLNRCSYLMNKAPSYWFAVGIYLYKSLVNDNLNFIENLERNKVKTYELLFPGLLPSEIVNMSEFKYNMKKLPEIVQGYVMGYPIHKYIPSKEILTNTINEIDNIGIDEYCKLIEENNLKSMSDHEFIKGNIVIANTCDVLTENIQVYNSFDVIRYYTDTHVQFFTRPEFGKILSNKKNPYTNNILPLNVLIEINTRSELSLMFHLPASLPISELLKAVENDKLFNHTASHDQEPHESNQVNPIEPRIIQPQLPVVGRVATLPANYQQISREISIDNGMDLLQRIFQNHVCNHHNDYHSEISDNDSDSEYYEVDENGVPIEEYESDDSVEVLNY